MPRQSPCGAGADANVAKKGQKRARAMFALPGSGAKHQARTVASAPQTSPDTVGAMKKVGTAATQPAASAQA